MPSGVEDMFRLPYGFLVIPGPYQKRYGGM